MLKKYLYRETEEVFNKLEKLKGDTDIPGSKKFSTKDAITYLINRGFEAYEKDRAIPKEVPKEANT